ncbi:YdaU family protein, partial [Pedobacter sp.]|uniref:YdaU family protein n=1 Tax=Pedobacter sp. TaxID=1411316 RepID=UPI003D7FC7E4
YMHHIGDFISDTHHLSPLEECFYRRALDFYYLNESPLPKITQQVYRRLRAKTQEETKAVDVVLEEFFTEEEDGFHNHRCDLEIQAYQQNAHKSRVKGGKGGRPRKNKPEENPDNNLQETSQVNLGSENVTQNNLNHQPSTVNHQPSTVNQEDNTSVLEVFDFWREVFKKNDRTKLEGVREKKIKARLKEGYSVDEIKTAILNISKSDYHVQNGYTDIELICRDQIKLDKNIAMSNAPQNSNYSAAGKTQAEMDKWNNFLSDRDQQFDAIDVTPGQQYFIEGK